MAFSEVNRLVKERIPLDKIISKYVKLEPSSGGFKALCPFHQEKTPSFHINSNENFYYCFGCGASGNAITFLMQKEGLTFNETIKKLAEEFNIPELSRKVVKIDESREEERDEIFNVNRIAAKIFISNLEQNREALEYLAKRGVAQETRKQFGIGCVASGDQFIEQMQGQKVSLNAMARAGLIRLDNLNRPTSLFFNRIIFPIVSKKRIVAFGGRIISGNGPKYINSPDTLVFNKKEHLFGIDFVRKGVEEFPFLILCEGYMDVIAMRQNNFKTAVASLGTAVNSAHLELLAKFNKPLVLLLDGDDAGRNAAKRIATLQIPDKLDLRAAFITEEGEDPDSLLKKDGGATIVKNLIESAKPLFQELIDEQLALYNSLENLEEKLKVEWKIREIFNKIPPMKTRTYALYIQKKSDNAVKIYSNGGKKMRERLYNKAEKGEIKIYNLYDDETVKTLKKLIAIASLHSEFVKPLEKIKNFFIYSDYGTVFEKITAAYDNGEDMESVLDLVDEKREIANEFKEKSFKFIDKFFNRGLALIQLKQNEILFETLKKDSSDEANVKLAEIVAENKLLARIVKDNKIKND